MKTSSVNTNAERRICAERNLSRFNSKKVTATLRIFFALLHVAFQLERIEKSKRKSNPRTTIETNERLGSKPNLREERAIKRQSSHWQKVQVISHSRWSVSRITPTRFISKDSQRWFPRLLIQVLFLSRRCSFSSCVSTHLDDTNQCFNGNLHQVMISVPLTHSGDSKSLPSRYIGFACFRSLFSSSSSRQRNKQGSTDSMTSIIEQFSAFFPCLSFSLLCALPSP